MLAIICRSYGAYRDLDTDNYKDFAPTEHDLGLPNVQTPHAGGDARATMWDGVPARQIVENGLEMSKLQAQASRPGSEKK